MSLVKVMTGSLNPKGSLYKTVQEKAERIGQYQAEFKEIFGIELHTVCSFYIGLNIVKFFEAVIPDEFGQDGIAPVDALRQRYGDRAVELEQAIRGARSAD